MSFTPKLQSIMPTVHNFVRDSICHHVLKVLSKENHVQIDPITLYISTSSVSTLDVEGHSGHDNPVLRAQLFDF